MRTTFPTLTKSIAVAVMLFSAAAVAHAGQIQASLSAREAYVGAPVMLYLEVADSSSHDQPQIASVSGLDIKASGTPSRSSQTTIINGRRTDRTSTTYTWQVIPRQEGTFEIPPIRVEVDGQVEQTRPLRFAATKSETGDLLFAEVTGQQKQIYVGQPLPLTLNMWVKPYHDREYDITLSEENMWQLISQGTNWGVFGERLEELAEKNQRPGGVEVLREDSNGDSRSYYQYKIEATIYPKRPGQIDVGDLQIVVDYPTKLEKGRDPFGSMFEDDFFGGRFPFADRGFSPFNRNTLTIAASRPVVASAEVAPIDVTAIPMAGRPADYRGTVGHYQIVTHAVPTSVKAGDPITLHIGIRGDGPMDLVQAPPLASLPQLTADFKVANEPLAGIVEGDTKLFTTTIRPRRAGITEIPAIPLSYFDPTTEKFVTVESTPIAIEVAEAERLALESIVGAPHDNSTPGTAAAAEPRKFDPAIYSGSDAIVSTSKASQWLWIAAAMLPALIVGGAWFSRRRMNSDNSASSPSHHQTQKAIHLAHNPAEIGSALASYIGQRFNHGNHPTARTFTRSEVTAQLRAAGQTELAARVEALLIQCEQAAYGASGNQTTDGLKSEATAIMSELSRAKLGGTDRSAAVRVGYRQAIAVACIVLAALAIGIPTGLHLAKQTPLTENMATNVEPQSHDSAMLASLSDSQKATLLEEANAAYQRGMTSGTEDAATANEAFSQAAAKYQQLVDSGIRNSDLYVNLANAYVQAGSPGRAIANYERALQLNPYHGQAFQNLKLTQSGLHPEATSAMAASSGWQQTLTHWTSNVSPILGVVLAAAAWSTLCIAVVGGMFVPSAMWRWATIPATCVLLVGVTLANVHRFTETHRVQAIVAAPTVALRDAPGDNFPENPSHTVTEGESLEVLKANGPWLQVQTPTGSIGWISQPQVELLDT
ncbi:BatD family protein [Bremerella cremea]|uniref:BatD family protein n=1 Tax=Bremerella cremea TaxID=1031537 RepID=UPI0031ECDABD